MAIEMMTQAGLDKLKKELADALAPLGECGV